MGKILDVLSFDPNQQPTAPRDAATVIVIRPAEGCAAIQVHCVLRHPRSGFMGGALVFPGGKVDAADADAAWQTRARGTAARGEVFASEGASALTLAVAAAREAFEEAGVLATHPELGQADLDALRIEIATEPLGDALARRGLLLSTDRLEPFARWITPEAESRRFDARFFVLEMPAGQVPRHDAHETTLGLWDTPSALLDRAARGEFFLAPPTLRALELLAEAKSVKEALAVARSQSLLPICPVFVPGDPPFLALPGDPSHPVAERRVDGPSRYVLRDGRFSPEDAAPNHAADEGR